METVGRLLRLLSLLQARPYWSGPDLAVRLEVTERTLRRDVARLRELGYPVEAVSGPGGGYRLTAGGALPPLLLDDDEAVVVAMSLQAVARGGLPGLQDPAVAALAKIEQVFPRRLRDRVDDLTEATVMVGGASPRRVTLDVGMLVTLARACRGGMRIRFQYRDASGRRSERHVDPHRLVNVVGRWYLVAWDRDREDWRTFRVDRLAAVTQTGMRVVSREVPDPASLVTQGIALAAYRHEGRVLLEVDPAVARREVPPTVGLIEETPQGTLLRVGADDLGWIARYLANLPWRFQVVDPPELKEAIRDLARALLAQVDGSLSGEQTSRRASG